MVIDAFMCACMHVCVCMCVLACMCVCMCVLHARMLCICIIYIQVCFHLHNLKMQETYCVIDVNLDEKVGSITHIPSPSL